MIEGAVLPTFEPMVNMHVFSSSGEEISLNVLVDTGFTGSFSLPDSVAKRLGLTKIGSDSIQFGDGSIYAANLYDIDIVWDGLRRTIYADAFGADLVVGTELLRDYELLIQFVNGGHVRVTKLQFKTTLT